MLAISFIIDLITWPLTIPFILAYYAFSAPAEAVLEGGVAGAEIGEGVINSLASASAAEAGGGVVAGYFAKAGTFLNEISLSLSDASGPFL